MPDATRIALATLAAMIGDLDGYITRKAEAIAAPVIAAAQEAALEPAGEARASARRWEDVSKELHRRIAALERRAESAGPAERERIRKLAEAHEAVRACLECGNTSYLDQRPCCPENLSFAALIGDQDA